MSLSGIRIKDIFEKNDDMNILIDNGNISLGIQRSSNVFKVFCGDEEVISIEFKRNSDVDRINELDILFGDRINISLCLSGINFDYNGNCTCYLVESNCINLSSNVIKILREKFKNKIEFDECIFTFMGEFIRDKISNMVALFDRDNNEILEELYILSNKKNKILKDLDFVSSERDSLILQVNKEDVSLFGGLHTVGGGFQSKSMLKKNDRQRECLLKELKEVESNLVIFVNILNYGRVKEDYFKRKK